ncbi:MAG: flagellar biosynthesis anti-sigma factor FlgM [Planctomycetaceae bacterium]|jgi:anti-sigma28 factor (negative regulator of flagellin synthesis)|nr:flagellar biosynthesis anti-sigma factor FlgM [Planctomycetaceae bacterium]
MNVANFSPIQSSPNIQGTPRPSVGQSHAETFRRTASLKDTISFSDEALRLNDVTKSDAGAGKIRFDLVNRVKAEIAAGTYDTSDKMDIALDRMASRIF